MIPNEYLKIFGALLLKSQKKEISWSKGPLESQFFTSFREFSLLINKDHEETNNFNFIEVMRFELNNKDGKEIDSFSIYENETGFKEAVEIFDLARRNALKIDTAIKEIEASLHADFSSFQMPKLTEKEEPKSPPKTSSDDDLPF